MIFTFDKGIAPDLPERGHGFLVKARNCYSGVLGYEPVRSPSPLTTALPAAWLGSGAFRDPTGVVTLLAAASASTVNFTGSISGTTLYVDAIGSDTLGSEMVVNGTFDTTTTGWTPTVNASLSIVAARLRVTNVTVFGHAFQQFAVTPGRTYRVSYEGDAGTTNPSVFIGDTGGSLSAYATVNITGTQSGIIYFTPTTNSVQITLEASSSTAGQYADFDNISMKLVTSSATLLCAGMPVSGAGITAGTVITARGTTTGGIGSYTVNNSQTVASETMTSQSGGIYTLTATTATNVYSSAITANWFFCQFGGLALGFNGAAPVKYNLSSGVAALLGGSPPSASMGAIVRDFVFVAGNSTNQNRVYWSSINNAEGWTIGINQCSTQDLPDEGAITGLSGGEFGLAFQDAAINIFEYIGSPAIFSRRKISNSIGALCHGSIAQHGNSTFFYSRRGFYKWSPNEPEPVPIGRNKIDKTFRNSYSITDIRSKMRCTIDPERSLVIWSMPDRLWVYNFENDMWSDILYPGIVGITFSRTASITLEQLAVTYPSIETVTPPMDDPFWNAGDPLLTFAYSDNKLYTFGGSTNLDASLRLPNLEINEGRVTHVRSSKVTGNMLSAQIAIDCRARLGDNPVSVSSQDFRSNGELPIRCAGRYLQPEITIYGTNPWSSVQGVDLAVSGGGLM